MSEEQGAEGATPPENVLLTTASADGFITGQGRAVRAILFTKKEETPGLWLRLAEALQETVCFGEVRKEETALLERSSSPRRSLPNLC